MVSLVVIIIVRETLQVHTQKHKGMVQRNTTHTTTQARGMIKKYTYTKHKQNVQTQNTHTETNKNSNESILIHQTQTKAKT